MTPPNWLRSRSYFGVNGSWLGVIRSYFGVTPSRKVLSRKRLAPVRIADYPDYPVGSQVVAGGFALATPPSRRIAYATGLRNTAGVVWVG